MSKASALMEKIGLKLVKKPGPKVATPVPKPGTNIGGFKQALEHARNKDQTHFNFEGREYSSGIDGKGISTPIKKKAAYNAQEILKVASMPSMMSRATGKGKQWLPFILASVAAGTALQGVQIMIDKIIDYVEEHGHKAKSKDYYKKMLDAHPTLKKQDPKTIAKYWDSLYHFAPSMAQDPLAAGAYIRQSLERGLEDVGGPSPDIVSNLTNIDASLTKTKEIKKPGKRFLDLTTAFPAKEVGLELVKQDIKEDPNAWGLGS